MRLLILLTLALTCHATEKSNVPRDKIVPAAGSADQKLDITGVSGILKRYPEPKRAPEKLEREKPFSGPQEANPKECGDASAQKCSAGTNRSPIQ